MSDSKQPVIVSTEIPVKKVLESSFAGSSRIHANLQKAFSDKIVSCKNQVSGLVLANGSCTKATGFALERHPDEKFTADMLNPNSIRCLVMSKIDCSCNGTGAATGNGAADESKSSAAVLDDKYFSSRLEAISEACPQFSNAPIRGEIRMNNNSDGAYWGHELGENGYVGVVTEAQIPGAPHLGGEGYYILASVGAPLLGQDLIGEFAKEGLTWGQVQADKRMQFWKRAVERNAKRVAYAAAEALGVKIQTDVENPSTVFRSDPVSEAPRRTADPEVVQHVSSVVDDVQYDHCAHIATFSRQDRDKQRTAVVAVSPYVHNMVTLPTATVNSSIVPTVTGRTADVYSDQSFVAKAPKLAAHIGNAFTWEGSAPTNDRLNPAAYRPFDASFFSTHFAPPSISSAAEVPRVQAYNTVAMKIASRALQRPM